MHSSLKELGHRPWPLPSSPWVYRQTWKDLLFAHWPVNKEVLRPLVPKELTIQEFDGTSWIGIVPFSIQAIVPRFSPDIPYISNFPEINVRLYVEHEGKPGVFFLSLDASRLLAVISARIFFFLPYHWAKIEHNVSGDSTEYQSMRILSKEINFKGTYKPTSEIYTAKKGTLEHWLTERYCLYSFSGKKIYRVDIHHKPWPLQKAEAEIIENNLFKPFSIDLKGAPNILHFSKNIEVVGWMPDVLKN